MLRRLATFALSLSLLVTAASPALAAGFAAPPPDTARAPISLEAPRRLELDIEQTPTLNDAMRARLRKVLIDRRDRNVRAFAAYVKRGSFPHNFENDGVLNVWRDREGHLCAAATMISRSGAKKLVNQVAKADNFIRLADVTEGALLDWILTSGLTHAEVVAIQEPFMGREEPMRPRDWRTAEDARLRARYAEVQRMLASERASSLDAAIDALAARPDLVAKLIR